MYYLWKLNFWFEFKTANQQEFEPGSSGPKAAMQTIKLHSIELLCFLILNNLGIMHCFQYFYFLHGSSIVLNIDFFRGGKQAFLFWLEATKGHWKTEKRAQALPRGSHTMGFREHKDKLMWLGVTNQMDVVKSNLKSKFYRGFQSNSKSNNKFESTIPILIYIRSYLMIVDRFWSFVQL